MSDNVNHPPHYLSNPAKCLCGKPIECIQVTRHMGFNLGNAMKYIWRAEHKGKTIEDLKKAIWYLRDAIKTLTLQEDEICCAVARDGFKCVHSPEYVCHAPKPPLPYPTILNQANSGACFSINDKDTQS